MLFLIAAKVHLMTQKDTVMASFQKGTFYTDAQAKLMGVYTAAGPKVDSYVKQAKQAITQTTEKAKVEVSKLKPLLANFQEKVVTHPLLVQAKEKAATILSSMKAK